MDDEACCAPRRPDGATNPAIEMPSPATAPALSAHAQDLAPIPRGTFAMGSEPPYRWPADREGPVRQVHVKPFFMAKYAVSNADYAAFVAATRHTSDAERFGWSFVFEGLLPDDFGATRGVAAAPWWRQVEGADWAHPLGPQSDIVGLQDHPVVHISHNDAVRFCEWSKTRLPTEAEWERAARGGLPGRRFPWGDEFAPNGTTMCNIFEGEFPAHNSAADGYAGTAPVDTYPPNRYGLLNMAGNVWEWCSDAFSSASDARVIRGGSYLCHDSYCDRYRVAARSSNGRDSSTGNMGFRVAADDV